MSKPTNIGEYLRLKLRSKNISNHAAGSCIGLSESAFEKILTQDDIYASRLIKLSELVGENLFEFYNSIAPIKSYYLKSIEEHSSIVDSLKQKIDLQNEIIQSKIDIIDLQKKYVLELEGKLKS